MATNDGVPQYVTRAQLAELFGVDPATVRNWEEGGYLYRVAKGQYPLKESIDGYTKMKVERAMKRAPETSAFLDKEEWEVRERRAKALKLELGLTKEAGEVVTKEAYSRQLVDLLSPIRQSLKNIPHRWAPQLAHLDLRELKLKMEELVHALLTELNTPPELPDFSEIDKIEQELLTSGKD